MGVVIWIIFIIALIVAALLVNKVQQLYMKMMGADVMFFNGKKKIISIVIIAIVLTAFVINLFGIEIPRQSKTPKKDRTYQVIGICCVQLVTANRYVKQNELILNRRQEGERSSSYLLVLNIPKDISNNIIASILKCSDYYQVIRRCCS